MTNSASHEVLCFNCHICLLLSLKLIHSTVGKVSIKFKLKFNCVRSTCVLKVNVGRVRVKALSDLIKYRLFWLLRSEH